MFLSNGRKEVERFCETRELPNGSFIPAHKWTGRGLLAALVTLIITLLAGLDMLNIIGWMFIVLVFTSWAGPYIEYAIAWNRASKKE